MSEDYIPTCIHGNSLNWYCDKCGILNWSKLRSATSPAWDLGWGISKDTTIKFNCTETVDHPPHYTQGGIECIDAIQAALSPDEFRGFCKGNVMKYAWREKAKGGVESLQKAKWYLEKLLKVIHNPTS